MDRFDAVVIGAGPAGASAALVLARAKAKVLLVDRGKTPGAKNVFGGRIYAYPLTQLFPEGWKDCPMERWVVKEGLAFQTEDSSFSVQFECPRLGAGPSGSFTAFRPKFDTWLASKAEQAGATLISGIKVDDLVQVGGKIRGIVAGQDQVLADVVIAADGVTSSFAQKANLRPALQPEEISVGVKETIELPKETINDRFNLNSEEGVAQVFAGFSSGYFRGGGFLYTNKTSLSLGLVVESEDLAHGKRSVADLMGEFKAQPQVQKLIKGGKSTEYSAHMIPELGLATPTRVYTDGFLVAGDAGGFLVNTGYSFRGVDMAMKSGIAAANTVLEARETQDYSAAAMSRYMAFLEKEKVLQDLERFRGAPFFMKNPRLFSEYPKLICDLAERVYTLEGNGHDRILELAMAAFRQNRISVVRLLKDLVGGSQAM